MSTILGSCVAACIWDPVAGVGGMNHFLLPKGRGNAETNLSHGSFAMEKLINELLKRGARRSRLRAKLFGGANVIDTTYDIGDANARFARTYLANEGIPIESESLGGVQGRRVRFAPADGAAKMMYVTYSDADDIETSAPTRDTANDVELF